MIFKFRGVTDNVNKGIWRNELWKKIVSFILDESEVVEEHAIENTVLVFRNAWQGLGRGQRID